MKKYLFAFFISAVSAMMFSVNFVSATIDDSCIDYMRSRGMMNGYGYYGMMNWDGTGGGWGIVAMIIAIALWVIFWAVVIVVTIALVRWLYIKVFRSELMILGKKETPEDILKMRYAKGDISKEQYENMRKEISHK